MLITFDRTLAASLGVHVWRFDQLFLVLLALAIVTALQTVGNVLVLAMLITPAATARLVADRLPRMLVLAASIGAISGVGGLYLSYYWSIASGAAVVLVATAIFFVVWSVVHAEQPLRRVLRRHSARGAGADGSARRPASLTYDHPDAPSLPCPTPRRCCSHCRRKWFRR